MTPQAPQARCDPRYACTDFVATKADEARLQACRASSPVKKILAPAIFERQPLYLFILADSFSGSSALHSLLMTSPRVTNLCPANVWMCEGVEILRKKRFLRQRDRWTNLPLNWTAVLQEYEKYWSMGPPSANIRVDKSTFTNVVKLPGIMEHFANDKSRVAFISMTRSPCTRNDDEAESRSNHHNQTVQEKRLKLQRDALASLRLAGFTTLEVKYEDLLMDPCSSSNALLDFLPELETLNPGVTGYDYQKYPGIINNYATSRVIPLLDYALTSAQKGNWFGSNHPTSVDASTHRMLQDMGYGSLKELPCK